MHLWNHLKTVLLLLFFYRSQGYHRVRTHFVINVNKWRWIHGSVVMDTFALRLRQCSTAIYCNLQEANSSVHKPKMKRRHKIQEQKVYLGTRGLINISAVWRENQLLLFELFVVCVFRSQDGGGEELPRHTSTPREDTPLFPDRRLYRTAEGRSRHHVVGGTAVFTFSQTITGFAVKIQTSWITITTFL